ncbi:hypothetical protein PLANPX_1290 [Lacipirellula parvula]|uniref:Uncharacterized protein n=1 Tax=Lacipirellula parvula TaxID=2650471 RepID=A0A5K7X559_9BACT|nr:hypothetical protein PLANPX_1290 [Lacipirellula parvula]
MFEILSRRADGFWPWAAAILLTRSAFLGEFISTCEELLGIGPPASLGVFVDRGGSADDLSARSLCSISFAANSAASHFERYSVHLIAAEARRWDVKHGERMSRHDSRRRGVSGLLANCNLSGSKIGWH